MCARIYDDVNKNNNKESHEVLHLSAVMTTGVLKQQRDWRLNLKCTRRDAVGSTSNTGETSRRAMAGLRE